MMKCDMGTPSGVHRSVAMGEGAQRPIPLVECVHVIHRGAAMSVQWNHWGMRRGREQKEKQNAVVLCQCLCDSCKLFFPL